MTQFNNKFSIGDRVEFALPGEQCTGEIFSITFYADNITYGVRNNGKKEEFYTMPEGYLNAI